MEPENTEQVAEEIIDTIEEESEASSNFPLIFLKTLEVENFRSLKEAVFNFQPGLNVIIGANNAAKTALIDALRIVFNLGTFEKKEDLIRLKPTDVYVDGGEAQKSVTLSFKATFYIKEESDLPAQFYEMLCVDEEVEITEGEEKQKYLVLRLLSRVDFEFNTAKGRYEYARSELKGGKDCSNPVSHEVLDYIRSVYLAPLRDIVNDRGRVGAEIERLILSHTPRGKEEERKDIPKKLRDQATALIKAVTKNNHQVAAGKNLSEYAKPYNIGENSLSFMPAGITEELFSTLAPIFAHSLHGLGKLPLSSNGLGINQLIYASIVLSRRGDTETDQGVYKFFLIEEPEAHLHPQLQDSFFYALNRIKDHQVFVTSHSPLLTAKADIDRVIVMRRSADDKKAVPLHLAEAYEDKDADKRYLHKFLDSTRSQLLFAKGAIFVEGATEAILMQRLSEVAGTNLRDLGIEVVVLGSDEGFDHFRPLFDNGGDVYCRAVFITDGDEPAADVKADAELKKGYGVFDKELVVTGNTAVAEGYGTFEFGLLRAACMGSGNEAMQKLLHEAFKKAAPDSMSTQTKKDNFAKDFLDYAKPASSYKKMKQKTAGKLVPDAEWHDTWHTNDHFRTAKSDFAFYLDEELLKLSDVELREEFTLPKYIKEALDFVIGTAKPSEMQDDTND